jgi:hypothetical protein
VLAQLPQEVRLAREAKDVHHQVRLAWTETDDTARTGMSRVVRVVISAEADDGRAPHLRLPPGGLLEKLQERLGVLPASLVLNSGNEAPDAYLGRLGLGRPGQVVSCACAFEEKRIAYSIQHEPRRAVRQLQRQLDPSCESAEPIDKFNVRADRKDLVPFP